MQFEDKPLTFRFKIRELREKYGYTQKKMSELLGIERSTYTYYDCLLYTSPSPRD